MRIVIDTNVIFSGLYSNRGASYKILRWLFSRHVDASKILVVSTPLVIEYQDVLLRPENFDKFPNLSNKDITDFVSDICSISVLQEINFLWRPFLKDHKDDMVLETAFNSGAEYIITHNTKDFSNVNQYFEIEILKPAQLLKTLFNEGKLL